jgi:hypothetical protein
MHHVIDPWIDENIQSRSSESDYQRSRRGLPPEWGKSNAVICGSILMGLNFIHSTLTVTKTPGKPWPAFIIFFTLLVGSLEIVWISFWKYYN